MLRLKTPWGMYLLENAVKIDIFPTKSQGTWTVYLCIDGYKHSLQSFESKSDAFVFSSLIRDAISEMFCHQDNAPWDLTDSITAALNEIEQIGLVK